MSITMAALGAAGSIGSAIIGAISSAKRNKEAQDFIREQKAENKRWYNIKMSQDYTQRSDAQNILRKQRETLQEQYKAAVARNIVAGGTDESLALQQENANKSMAETMGNIAAGASAARDAAEQQYRQQEAQLTQQEMANKQAQAQAVAQAAGQAVSAGLDVMGNGIAGIEQNQINKNKKVLTPPTV